MIAFNGDEKLKADLLKEIAKHRAQDQIIKGTYGRENGVWKGCAIGCALHSLNIIKGVDLCTDGHFRFEEELGIPIALSRLFDSIFENLPSPAHIAWPERAIGSIPCGADLVMVWPQFTQWLLRDVVLPIVDLAFVRDVLVLYDEWLQTGVKPAQLRWRTYVDAVAHPVYSAAVGAARDAAYAAADDDSSMAANAACNAASAVHASSAQYFDTWRRIADKLVDLMSAAPVSAAVD